MELTLKRLLEQAEFTDARKGYDRAEVDEFLDRAVAMATKVEAKLTETLGQARTGDTTQAPDPAEVEAEVERRVSARLADRTPDPDSPPDAAEEEAAEEVRRTIILAQRTADAAVREAREDAAKLLADARERAAMIDAQVEAEATSARAEVTAEARAERAAARERLAGEIGELEGIREALRSDVTVLERHVEEQRNQLRSTVGELQRLLDDPVGFRMAPTPALLDPRVPDFSAPSGQSAPPPATDDQRPATGGAADAPPADTPPTEQPPTEHSGPVAEQTAAVIEDGTDAPSAAAGPSSFDEVDHTAPGVSESRQSGPPTSPVSAVDLGIARQSGTDSRPGEPGEPGEDAFLTELRKAMGDEEPLGPRDHLPQQSGELFDEDDRRSWRFGKRR